MLEAFADLRTSRYVLTDEAEREVAAPHDTRPGPAAACPASEVITLTLAADPVGRAAETRFLAASRRTRRALVPSLPARARYDRRRRWLVAGTDRIRGAIVARPWRVLAAEGRDLCVIASGPVPVGG